ncbi:hypothetical protein FE391_19635 [Nonomuraea sp. KC401]|uniref:hypothetical protein n=1 Tax=unclassified Nonomuraea TaxID=2593643 RepID=UPI0010FE615F|nr:MULTISPECIES: hypothetical protein [unclassified Nonomuraea]NBE95813.1 hypothetical protein [Nonomuraea sp. K271]TLF71299.1 hypothetical protein FE391_19635 [Nonomuraea sp. KC401]
MKFATAPIRRLSSLGIGLAVGATALMGAPAAAAAAPPEGAYWHSRALMTTTHPWRFGSKTDPYSLVQRRISENWRAPDGRAWFGFRELGTLPKSAAAKKAWRRDGSPSKWSESIDGKTVKLSIEPAKGRVAPVRDENSFRLAGQRLTYDEVQRLPADPNILKDWLGRAGKISRVQEGALDGWVRSSLPEILHSIPAPKEVRAAAYQALLTMPGVRAGGNVKDTLGRSGAAVLIDRTHKGKSGTSSVKIRLIVDSNTMVLLSRDQTVTDNGKVLGGKTHNETLVEVGWTNSKPAVPALP